MARHLSMLAGAAFLPATGCADSATQQPDSLVAWLAIRSVGQLAEGIHVLSGKHHEKAHGVRSFLLRNVRHAQAAKWAIKYQ
jgi:hypothetical protein